MSNLVGEKPKGSRPTIADVARLSGVAKATVSKALDPTGRYGLSGPLRQRITEVADQLGYRAHSGGRSSGTRARLVGLLAHPSSYLPSEVCSRMMHSVNAALMSRGYRMLYVALLDGFEWENLLEEPKLNAWLIACQDNDTAQKLVQKLGPRTVLLNCGTEIAASRILADDAGAARLLVGHMLELGHRTLAFCQDARAPGSGAPVDAALATRREQVEMAALAAGGTCEVISSPDELLARWTSSRPVATAVITATFRAGMQLLHGCGQRGIRVPADLSIASFDDADAAPYLSPALTAVRMPADEMGREAALLLVDQIENQQSALPRKILMAQTLMVRESTAAARQDKNE